MKEMIYTSRLEIPIILDESFYENFHYICISWGTHPCCYVEIPETHGLYLKNASDINNINAHMGITFSGKIWWPSTFSTEDTWFIGWDYAHGGDYFYFDDSDHDIPTLLKSGYKHTTEELIQDCCDVIDQLNKFETKVNMYE